MSRRDRVLLLWNRAPLAWNRALLVSLTTVVLVACASGPAERDRFYRLEVPAPTPPLPEPVLPGVLEIDRPRADHLVRERKILRSEGAGATELIPYAYDFWVDSPTSMVQRELARWLEASGAIRRAVLPEAGVRERWLVSGRLERFEYVAPAGHVLVVLELRLKDQQNGRLLVQRRYSAQAPAAGGVAAAVPAFGEALAGIFEQFVADAAARP